MSLACRAAAVLSASGARRRPHAELGLLSGGGLGRRPRQRGPLKAPRVRGRPSAVPCELFQSRTAVGGLLFLRNRFLEPALSLGCWPLVKFGMTWDCRPSVSYPLRLSGVPSLRPLPLPSLGGRLLGSRRARQVPVHWEGQLLRPQILPGAEAPATHPGLLQATHTRCPRWVQVRGGNKMLSRAGPSPGPAHGAARVL